jgi:predicted DNA-binding ribbon-helix-helix protein
MKSVRFPRVFWNQLEKRARSKNLTAHAAIRVALAEWVGRA